MTQFKTFLRHDGSVDLAIEGVAALTFENTDTVRELGNLLIEHADRHDAKIRESGERTTETRNDG